jgi:hypothetical protein
MPVLFSQAAPPKECTTVEERRFTILIFLSIALTAGTPVERFRDPAHEAGGFLPQPAFVDLPVLLT